MIISHKHKFIFIKTRKTAGTSIEIALSGVCGKDDIVTPISKSDEIIRRNMGYEGPKNYSLPFNKYSVKDFYRLIRYGKKLQFFNHMSAREVRSYIEDTVWDNYYKFAFDRNPFDKVVSLYYYYGGDKRYGSFSDFINSGDMTDLRSFELYSIKGQVVVDDVFRYEEIPEALKVIESKVGINLSEMMPSKKTKGTYRKTKDYKSLIDDETKELIEVFFAREMRYLGYTF